MDALEITGVEAYVLETPGDYGVIEGIDSHGPKFTSVIRVSTDAGLDGYGQVETQPHVVNAIIAAPGEASGVLRASGRFALGEDPCQVERLGTHVATDQIMPRDIPGWSDYNLYPLGGPDLVSARQLAQRNLRNGNAVLYTIPLPNFPTLPR
jgi:hypothetical protein